MCGLLTRLASALVANKLFPASIGGWLQPAEQAVCHDVHYLKLNFKIFLQNSIGFL
jgi:hypothetical protein